MAVPHEKDYQYLRFVRALEEEGMPLVNPEISHWSGKCKNDGVTYPVIWPRAFVNRVSEYWGEKDYLFGFMGFKNQRRDWVKYFDHPEENNYVDYTDRGRKIDRGEFDSKYWRLLALFWFSVCPAGDCPWTFRLIESCFAGSIPVIPEDALDIHAGNFICLKTDGETLGKGYKEATRYNLKRALELFTFFHTKEREALLKKFDKVQKDLDISDIYVKLEHNYA